MLAPTTIQSVRTSSRRLSSISLQKSSIWTSAAATPTPGAVAIFAKSKVITKHKKVMVPDFASMNMMDSRALFEHFSAHLSLRNLQLIIASSNNEKRIDYDQIGRQIEEASRGGMDGTLVVKGSGKHALTDSPTVRQQYADSINMVKQAGGRLLLPLRIDLPETQVLQDIERRMKMNPDGFMTHPVFDVSAVTPAVIKMLHSIVQEHPQFTVRIGTLWLSEEFFHRLASKEGKLVTSQGLDQYPMPAPPEDGDWGAWNTTNMLGVRKLVTSIGSKQKMSDSTYSRVGIGHSEENVLKIASVIEESSQTVDLGESSRVELIE